MADPEGTPEPAPPAAAARPASEPDRFCERGFHLRPVARDPVEAGDAVNVDFACPNCGEVEYTLSWTRAAWQRAQGKPQRRA